MEISELPLIELHDALEREFRHVADQQGVSFAVELAPGTPPIIATDPGRLRQVLKNLLTNAFKFTEHGDVTLRIGRPDGNWRPANGTFKSTRDVTAFSITDTGVGIAPEQQEVIFEAFAQADGSTARQYGGTGLGLSISRELVGLLGGEMTLDSTFGDGSTFTVYLPSGLGDDGHAAVVAAVAAPEDGDTGWPTAGEPFILPPESAEPNGVPGAELAGKKVLVVDDDFRNIFAITVLLERGEIEVVSAESGADAIALLEVRTDIDLVLMDIMMPVMDGYATMRAIRKSLPDRPLAIVALTAKTGDGERQRCLDAGATAYISKPVEDGPNFLRALSACLVDAARAGSGVPA
jgi:two-component system chemotaxis sensor kinase CheA